MRLVFFIFTSLMLASCSSYSSRFSGKDAKGLNGTMLNEIDKLVASGEIDKIYKKRPRKTEPELAIKSSIRAKLPAEEGQKIFKKDGYLYVK